MAPNPFGKATAEAIVALRERWHTKNHPFYLDFWQGKIGLEPMGRLMAQHYQHVARVLPSLGFAYSKAPPAARRFVLENMAEEEGLMATPGEDREAHDHQDLILAFCNTAGISTAEVQRTEQLPAWRARSYFYINTVREEPIGVYLAMGATQEGQQPALNAERCLPALRKFHGFNDQSPEIGFFTEHLVADAHHSSRQLQLVEELVTSEELKARALEVAETMVKTRWACMNDIYRNYVLKHQEPLPAGLAA
jgi:pyrroloquinoline quinone (PQQ) biosynthesis protein C